MNGMPALRFERGRVRLDSVPIPKPAPGEALLEVVLAGVCATDLEITKGYMDFSGTLGHEFIGRVVSVARRRGAAGADRASPGDRVAGEINLPCRACPVCRSGLGNHCPTRAVLGILEKDGVFAQYATLPLENLHPVPGTIPDEKAVFIEPLAAALEVLEQVDVRKSDRLLVIGDGRLGLLVAMVLARASGRVTLVGRHPEKMARVEGLGVRTVPVRRAGTLRRAFDVVVEASGGPEGWDTALAKLRPRGTLVLKTTVHGGRPWNPAPIVIDEITVVGSRCGPFPKAIEWLEKGWVDPTPLVAARFGLREGLRALEEARTPGVLKVLIQP